MNLGGELIIDEETFSSTNLINKVLTFVTEQSDFVSLIRRKIPEKTLTFLILFKIKNSQYRRNYYDEYIYTSVGEQSQHPSFSTSYRLNKWLEEFNFKTFKFNNKESRTY